MIADMRCNKKLNPIVTELFITGRKLNIYFVFVRQSYFAVPKNINLNLTHYFDMKIPDKRELQQTVFNHSSYIDFQNHILFWLLIPLLHQIMFYVLERILQKEYKS